MYTIEHIKRETKEILNNNNLDFNFSEEELYKASQIQLKAFHYNFDQGYQGIYELLEDKFCDKSTALIFYWLNEPLFYLNNLDANNPIHLDGKKLKSYIESRIANREFKEILQFIPINFIEGPMHMNNTLIGKEPYLKEIPTELFMPVGMNYTTTATCNEIHKHIDLSKIETLYFFDPNNYSDIKKITNCDSLVSLHLCFNGYIRTKPKPGNFSDLLHFKNLTTLRMDFDIHFKELEKIKELNKLKNLKINFGKDDFSVLNNLDNLKKLELTSSIAENINDIENLKNLEELILSICPKLTDIKKIEKLTNLKYLKVESCKKLKKLDGIFQLPINELIFKEVEITSSSFKGLENMQIKFLQLDCKSLKSIEFLPKKSLKELNLYRIESNQELKEKFKNHTDEGYKVIERDWNNAL